MSLDALVLAAMLRSDEAPAAERDRLTPVAARIAERAATAELFDGPAKAEATALLLVAIGRHESAFREEVRRCRRTGDSGKTIGLFQLMGPWAWDGERRSDICASDDLQTRLALRVLGTYRGVCGAGTRALLQAYASGTCRKPTRAARVIEDTFFALLRERQITLVGKTAKHRAKSLIGLRRARPARLRTPRAAS